MEQKLSNEEIARVFAMHLGCEVKNNIGKHMGKVVGSGLSGMVTINPLDTFDPRVCSTEILLIGLKPFSAISDEHAIEVAKVLEGSHLKFNYSIERREDRVVVWFATYAIHIFHNGIIQGSQALRSIYNNVYPHLISKDYAAPLWFGIDHWANGKTPIDLGIAYDKTKQ